MINVLAHKRKHPKFAGPYVRACQIRCNQRISSFHLIHVKAFYMINLNWFVIGILRVPDRAPGTLPDKVTHLEPLGGT